MPTNDWHAQYTHGSAARCTCLSAYLVDNVRAFDAFDYPVMLFNVNVAYLAP